MIIDCMADLHGLYPKLAGGDLLIVAGDLTATDSVEDHKKFVSWLRSQKYKMKAFIGGNHDNVIEKLAVIGDSGDSCYYLFDSGMEFEGLKIWGSPWTLTFEGINPNCTAFTGTEKEISEKFALIPMDTDILVTHSPPWGIFDLPKRLSLKQEQDCHAGSMTLRDHVQDRIFSKKEFYHIFGHIHECHGKIAVGSARFINCSHVNERYEPVNPPVRIIL